MTGLLLCGSLFTHLDSQQWPDFLGFFAEHLSPDGVLVFTTHGRQPIQWMREGFFDYGLSREEQRTLIEGYVKEGFGFVSPSNQEFGISLSSMAFVCRQLERCSVLRPVAKAVADSGCARDGPTTASTRNKIVFAGPRNRSLKVQVVATTVSTSQRKAPSHVNTLKESVEVVADPWKQSTYYDDAEKWTIIFWSEDHPFYPLFKRLDLTAVLELACGHGRHSEIVAERSGQLTLMDVHEENIEYCRTRLARFQNTVFFTNSGHDFQPITDDALTAIFCYDAMVHFSPDLVQAYLRDTARVLKPGGMALYHHSNYPAPLDRHYGQNPDARNHMTESLFRQFSDEAGLALVESLPIEWGGVADLDRLTLLRK